MDSASVLKYFKEITAIPRESGHEERMTEYLQQFAAKHDFPCKKDKIGNVVITKPASKGKENVPTLILQAHQDMVCEKNASFEFDFGSQPIPYVIDDGWMIAKETTLGADDGIGVAACLALMDSSEPMGKLECLFTISEETTMVGATNLEEGMITGSTLINLDSEDEGQMFVGCAGGKESHVKYEFEREPLRKGYKTVEIKLYGGIGGHSGDKQGEDERPQAACALPIHRASIRLPAHNHRRRKQA